MATGKEGAVMPYDEHDESGRFERKYTGEMVLEAIGERGGSASTSEVSREIGCSSRLALRRLRELEKEGQVEAREVGNTFLWTAVKKGSQ